MPAPATEPSARARELVRGAYDLHVHVEPDLAQRRIDDLGLARRFAELGLAGFVLKSHYVPTAERAAVVRAAVPGVDALGAITLNAGVGGLNAQAVEIAARGGARIVWLPTVDSENEASEDGPEAREAAGLAGDPGRVRRGRRRGRARCGDARTALAAVLARRRSARPRARDRAPRAGRDPHGRRRGARRRRRARRRHAPRLPDAGRPDRRAASSSPTRARCSSAASRRSTRARSRGSRRSRRSARRARSATCSRPISARWRTHRSRTGSR